LSVRQIAASLHLSVGVINKYQQHVELTNWHAIGE
jgi:hypothetical protein